MTSKSYEILYLFLMFMWCTSCTGTKVLQKNEKLYTGAKLHFEDKNNLENNKTTKSELEELLQPDPNTTLLGMRPPLWVHAITQNPKKENGLKNWLRDKFGEAPVLVEDADANSTEALLNKKLHNEGYFLNNVTYEWQLKKQSGFTIYNITLNNPYHFKKIEYPDSVNKLTGLINKSKQLSKLKVGHRYDLQRLMEERSRIENFLRDRGYYYFSGNHLLFETDTTIGNYQAETSLILKDGIPLKAKKQFKIGKIMVMPSYNTERSDSINTDTLVYNNVHYFDRYNEYKPNAIINKMNFKPGDLYSHTQHDLTINKLMGLGVFRYVNATYKETDDPNLLNAHFKLIPYKKKSIRMEARAISKSTGFVGPYFKTTFQNRNFLRGAELFQISLNAGFETQLSKENLFSYEVGLESSLSIPKFITPFNIENKSNRFVPNTIVRAGIKYMNRTKFFTLRSIDMGFGYKWNETLYKKHELFPVDINLVTLTNTTDTFETQLDNNPLVRQSYEEQFIFGGRYSYVYNTQATENKNKSSNLYFNGNIDLSGNIAFLLQKYIGGTSNNDASYELLGQPYAQFAKVDFDIRYYYQIDKNNKLATRLIAGIGYPYGNSETLPYVNQFSIGGSSSIRAFLARSLGPGSYNDTVGIVDQAADIKLEWNLEYRFNIIGGLKGATFIDAGNIWTLRYDENRLGSQFKRQKFLRDLAVGAGIGLRYDANFFVIRFDLATPLRVPSNEIDNKWVIDDIAFQNKTWRKDNLVLNIAIGYPF